MEYNQSPSGLGGQVQPLELLNSDVHLFAYSVCVPADVCSVGSSRRLRAARGPARQPHFRDSLCGPGVNHPLRREDGDVHSACRPSG